MQQRAGTGHPVGDYSRGRRVDGPEAVATHTSRQLVVRHTLNGDVVQGLDQMGGTHSGRGEHPLDIVVDLFSLSVDAAVDQLAAAIDGQHRRQVDDIAGCRRQTVSG